MLHKRLLCLIYSRLYSRPCESPAETMEMVNVLEHWNYGYSTSCRSRKLTNRLWEFTSAVWCCTIVRSWQTEKKRRVKICSFNSSLYKSVIQAFLKQPCAKASGIFGSRSVFPHVLGVSMALMHASLIFGSVTRDLHAQMCTQLFGPFMSYVLHLWIWFVNHASIHGSTWRHVLKKVVCVCREYIYDIIMRMQFPYLFRSMQYVYVEIIKLWRKGVQITS